MTVTGPTTGSSQPGTSTTADAGSGDVYAEAREHLRRADPVMATLIDAHPDFDPREQRTRLPKLDAFGALLFQIVGQQLSVRSARAIVTRIEVLFAGRLPSPEELLAVDPDAIRRAGLSRRKVETLRALAQQFTDGDLGDSFFQANSDEQIESKLTSIPGIGPWTARGFLMLALDRADVFPAGDLALRRAVKRLYGLERMPTEREMLEIAEPWRPYRTLASAYLFRSEFEWRTLPGTD